MSKSLVIMAAGLASRYGGAKQIEKVGPENEILMEYTIYDAMKAGFDRFIIVLKPEMLEDFRAVCGARLEKHVDVRYVFQTFDALPAFFTMPEGRTRPYGTVPAVLSAAPEIDGCFAALNADDFYGEGAFRCMSEALDELAETNEGAMVAYKLANTVSDFGTVTRGVCSLENGWMTEVVETFKIGKDATGKIRSFHDSEEGVLLPEDSAVSMNFWGFTPWMLQRMQTYFEDFLHSEAGLALKSECLLPTMIGELIASGELRVREKTTDETWFGMTYHEDRATTAQMLKKLTDAGKYPPILFA